jgi:DNA-binding transcriptional regulator YhcF (GntR family)
MQRALTELEREGLLVGGGTSGRTVTTDQGVLSAMKEQILEELARECAEKFLVFGVTPTQAARLLESLEERKENL